MTRSMPGELAAADWLRLHLSTLYRPEYLDALLDAFGDAREAVRRLRALDSGDAGGLSGLPRKLVAHLAKPQWRRLAREEVSTCAERGVALLRRDSEGWPVNLDGLPQMPLILACRGEWLDSDAAAVAIIGTRRPTPYGIRQARRFASGLAGAGITVVSGLARGIDGEVHRAAVDAGGRTVAVLGSGLGKIYPRENRGLAERMLEARAGVIVSEFPWAASPRRHHFPQRNRLLSGLSLGVVVIEAGERSGTLLTVDWALGHGRPVFVLPGRVEQEQAMGCVRLLQSGAQAVASPDEVIECLADALAAHLKALPDRTEAIASSTERDAFLNALAPLFELDDAWHPNAICERLDVEPGDLLRELTRLESDGWLRRGVGGKYVLERPINSP